MKCSFCDGEIDPVKEPCALFVEHPETTAVGDRCIKYHICRKCEKRLTINLIKDWQ